MIRLPRDAAVMPLQIERLIYYEAAARHAITPMPALLSPMLLC